MGGGSSKPPLRTLPADKPQVGEDGDVEDEIRGVDELGVAPIEESYPVPSPRRQVADTTVSDKAIPDSNHVLPILPSSPGTDHQLPFQSFDTPQLPPPVPVGTTLQKHFKKPKDTSDVTKGVTPFAYYRPPISPIPELPEETQQLALNSEKNVHHPTDNELKQDLNTSHSEMMSDMSPVSNERSKRNQLLRQRERREILQSVISAPSSLSTSPTWKGQLTPVPLSVKSSNASNSIQGPQMKERRVSIDNEDIVAFEAAEKEKSHRAETFSSVVKDLTKDLSSDRQKVRAILAWISKQRIGQLTFAPEPLPPDSPNGYMQLMQEGKGTFPVFFALLCRAANIKCAIINGISKGTHYVVGSKVTDGLANSWNAVFVDGAWQLVHTLWVCKALLGRREIGWKTIESDSVKQAADSREHNGKEVSAYNDYFIFTKPEEFIYRNFPDDENWQLLDEPITLDHFLSCSYLRPSFFQAGFRLVSEDKCSFVSENGDPCTIVIGFSRLSPDDIIFRYELRRKNDKNRDTSNKGSGKIVPIQNRHVLMVKRQDNVMFEVRFLLKGTFILRVYGGEISRVRDNPPWIMDVAFQCNKILEKTKPLPFDPGVIGWGPSFMSENKGLHVPTHRDSSITVIADDNLCIRFILLERLEIYAHIVQDTSENDTLNRFIRFDVVELEELFELRINVLIPHLEMKRVYQEEPALKVDVKDNSGDFSNACNYLIHLTKDKVLESFHVRKARDNLRKAMDDGPLTMLEACVNQCLEQGISTTDPELTAASIKLELLQCRRDLKTALLVNRVDVAEHALERTKIAKLHIMLKKDMARVKAHLSHLLRLQTEGGWLSDVPEIDRASLTELGHLRKPRSEVQLTAKAMYLLLGIKERNLTTWGKLQQLLNDQEGTLIEMARLEKYIDTGETSLLSIDSRVRDRVRGILQAFSESDVRRIDNTAVAFYLWAKNIIRRLPQKLPEREEESSKSPRLKAHMTQVGNQIETPAATQGTHTQKESIAQKVPVNSSRVNSVKKAIDAKPATPVKQETQKAQDTHKRVTEHSDHNDRPNLPTMSSGFSTAKSFEKTPEMKTRKPIQTEINEEKVHTTDDTKKVSELHKVPSAIKKTPEVAKISSANKKPPELPKGTSAKSTQARQTRNANSGVKELNKAPRMLDIQGKQSQINVSTTEIVHDKARVPTENSSASRNGSSNFREVEDPFRVREKLVHSALKN